MAELQGDEIVKPETAELGEQREDSESGDREGGEEKERESRFPIKLVYPDEPIVVYEHFSKSLNDFQKSIYHSKDDEIKHLTITAATLNAPVVPPLHHSPYCGFKLTKGDGFSVRLSDGRIIHATI